MLTVVVLVGVPGAGKSTFAGELASRGWTCINQDTLGDRRRCEEAFWVALSAGQQVVVDRCNHTPQQRAVWMRLALDMQRQSGRVLQLLAVALETPPAECKRRAVERGAHATLSAADAPHVIDRFLSEYTTPSSREGFHRVFRATSPPEAERVLHAQLLPLAAGHHQLPPYQGGAGQQQAWGTGQAAAAAASRWEGGFQQQQQQQQQWGGRGFGAGPGGDWRRPGDWQQPPEPQRAYQPPGVGVNESWRHGYATAADVPPQGMLMSQRAQQRGGAPQRGQWGSSGGGGRAAGAGQWRQPRPPAAGAIQQEESGAGQHQQWQQSRDGGRGQGQPPQSPRRGNIVPFGRRPDGGPASPRSPGVGTPQSPPRLLDDGADCITLLFDMNGTLTSHTYQRRSTGRNLARPGAHHLRRLAEKFRVGVFTSASKRTVDAALAVLEEAAGPGPRLFDRSLVLHRVHTQPVDRALVAEGKHKPWDTVKPLHPYFGKLHRVILVDDDAYKALPEEQGNMLHVPCWAEEDPRDTMLHHFVEVLLQVFGSLPPGGDVREHTEAASRMLHGIAERLAAEQHAAAVAGSALQQPAAGAVEDINRLQSMSLDEEQGEG